MLREFRAFASRVAIVDFAPGVIIGAALSAIVTSLVDDVFMPMIRFLPANIDTSNLFIVVATRTASQSSRKGRRRTRAPRRSLSVCSPMRL